MPAERRKRRSTATASRRRKPSCAAAKICAISAAHRLGKVEAISFEDRTVDIKKRKDTAGLHPEAVFAHTHVDAQVIADALVRIGEYVAEHGLHGDGPYQAARDLLLRRGPRVGGQPLRLEGETAVQAARAPLRAISRAASCRFRDRPARARPSPARA